MNKAELTKQLAEEVNQLAIYQERYDSIRLEITGWLRLDIERGEGSGAQEARREAHNASLEQDRQDAKRLLELQEKKVSDLIKKLGL